MIGGWVSNIQKYSLQDGPGIRTTVFLKGCPLACAWCHNPETRSAKPEIMVFDNRCIHCGQCFQACTQPRNLPHFEPGWVNPACDQCGGCVAVCPTGARQLSGSLMTSATVMREILKDRTFYDDSQGGATFSGGEPLVQPGFLRSLLTACRSHGVSTAVDTCGFAPWETLQSIAPLTDLFLFDLKFFTDALHRQFTGVSNQQILQNLRQLGQIHTNIWMRIPVIPGVNDTPEELEQMARFTTTVASLQQVNLLPYHRSGEPKFKRVRQPFGLSHISPPSMSQMEAVAERFRAYGLTTKIGG
jgi:pyruvate formate lyase activating enzyme